MTVRYSKAERQLKTISRVCCTFVDYYTGKHPRPAILSLQDMPGQNQRYWLAKINGGFDRFFRNVEMRFSAEQKRSFRIHFFRYVLGREDIDSLMDLTLPELKAIDRTLFSSTQFGISSLFPEIFYIVLGERYDDQQNGTA